METERPRRFYLKHFKAISHAISTYEDFDLLIDHLTEGTRRTFCAKGCATMLYDERERQLFPVSAHGISDKYLNKGPIVVSEDYSEFVTGEPVYIEDIRNDSRLQYPEDAVAEGIFSMLSVPIIYRKTPVGLIRIYHSDRIGFHEEDIESMRVMAEHLGLAIEYNGLRNFLNKVKVAMESLPLHMLK